MDSLRFATPWALALLAALPLLLLAAWPRRGGSPAVRFGALGAAGQAGRTWRVRFEPALIVLRLLGIALLVMALARPQRGEAASETSGEGIDIVLGFDVSSSMTQQFGSGRTRIDVAKEVLSDFVAARENDRVGIVAFQGSSITLSPLTTDYGALGEFIDDADGIVLADGTAIGTALGESVNSLRNSTSATRIVILLTDGENNAGVLQPLAAARIAERLGVRVYTVGVVGVPTFGAPNRSTLNVDEEALRRIAEITGGTYSRAEDPATLAAVYDRIGELEKSRVEGRTFTRYNDIAPVFLAAAVVLVAMEMALRYTAFRRAA